VPSAGYPSLSSTIAQAQVTAMAISSATRIEYLQGIVTPYLSRVRRGDVFEDLSAFWAIQPMLELQLDALAPSIDVDHAPVHQDTALPSPVDGLPM
jgi:hypothetical protein